MPTAKNSEGARFWRNILPRSAWVRLSGTGIRFVWRRWTARRRRRGAPNRSCSRITRSILSSYSPVSLPSRRPDLHSSHTRIWNVLSKWLLRQDVRNFLDTTFSYNLHFPSLRFFFDRLSSFSTSIFSFFFFFFLNQIPCAGKDRSSFNRTSYLSIMKFSFVSRATLYDSQVRRLYYVFVLLAAFGFYLYKTYSSRSLPVCKQWSCFGRLVKILFASWVTELLFSHFVSRQ